MIASKSPKKERKKENVIIMPFIVFKFTCISALVNTDLRYLKKIDSNFIENINDLYLVCSSSWKQISTG